MNLVFNYLGEECLVIIYSVSELAMGKVPVCLQPADNGQCVCNGSRVETERKQKGPQMKTAAAAFVYYYLASPLRVLSKASCNLSIKFGLHDL